MVLFLLACDPAPPPPTATPTPSHVADRVLFSQGAPTVPASTPVGLRRDHLEPHESPFGQPTDADLAQAAPLLLRTEPVYDWTAVPELVGALDLYGQMAAFDPATLRADQLTAELAALVPALHGAPTHQRDDACPTLLSLWHGTQLARIRCTQPSDVDSVVVLINTSLEHAGVDARVAGIQHPSAPAVVVAGPALALEQAFQDGTFAVPTWASTALAHDLVDKAFEAGVFDDVLKGM